MGYKSFLHWSTQFISPSSWGHHTVQKIIINFCHMFLDLSKCIFCLFYFSNNVYVGGPKHRYSYKFPFLESKGRIEVDDDRVGPLFEHTFPPCLSPSLSFVGIPRKVVLYFYLSVLT